MPTKIITSPHALVAWRDALPHDIAREISFVPFLGGLHHGHLSLIKAAKKTSKVVVCSLFLNNLQFQLAADVNEYPMDLRQDIEALKKEDVDVIFAPSRDNVYPIGDDYFPPRLDFLNIEKVPGEGMMRQFFFRGVGTVVTKLLLWFRPRFFFLGQKDFQQTVVLRRLCDEYFLATQIIIHPVVREIDGVAYASRNSRLSELQRREVAPLLYDILNSMKSAYDNGERRRQVLINVGEMIAQKHHLTLTEASRSKVNVEVSKQPVFLSNINVPVRKLPNSNLSGESESAAAVTGIIEYLSIHFWSSGRLVPEFLPSPGKFCIAASMKVTDTCRLVDCIVLCDFEKRHDVVQQQSNFVKEEANKEKFVQNTPNVSKDEKQATVDCGTVNKEFSVSKMFLESFNMYTRNVRTGELDALHQLECTHFRKDEAASKFTINFRIEKAGNFFMGLYFVDSDSPDTISKDGLLKLDIFKQQQASYSQTFAEKNPQEGLPEESLFSPCAKTNHSSNGKIGQHIPNSGAYDYEYLVGMINGTTIHANEWSDFTEETIHTHVPEGSTLCLHSVIICETLKRKRLGTFFLREYLSTIKFRSPHISSVALICRKQHISFYESVGFTSKGEWSGKHGHGLWWLMVIENF